MGLDYSFKLYFKKEKLWDVLLGVTSIAVHHHPPIRVHFPEHDLLIPFDTWGGTEKDIRFDDPDFYFATVLYFEEDEPINDYLRRLGNEDVYRGPPDPENKKVPIGFIYLTVFQEIPEYSETDLVLFDFGTTGTRMSILFSESSSIRKTFLQFAEKFDAVCGLLNREESAEVFWINHQSVDFEIGDPYMSPEEISRLHNS